MLLLTSSPGLGRRICLWSKYEFLVVFSPLDQNLPSPLSKHEFRGSMFHNVSRYTMYTWNCACIVYIYTELCVLCMYTQNCACIVYIYTELCVCCVCVHGIVCVLCMYTQNCVCVVYVYTELWVCCVCIHGIVYIICVYMELCMYTQNCVCIHRIVCIVYIYMELCMYTQNVRARMPPVLYRWCLPF